MACCDIPSPILPHLLLGSASIRTADFLSEHNITLVINATNNHRPCRNCTVRQILVKGADHPACSMKKHFEDIATLIHNEKESGGRVYVHCIAGRSRSPTLVMAYLMRYEGMSLKDSFGLVKGARRVVYPNRGFRQQLVDYEMELFGGNTLDVDTFGELVVEEEGEEEGNDGGA